MKTTVQFILLGYFRKIFLIFLFLGSTMFYSQETLATFQFNNTLAANPAPAPIGSPVLEYKNSSGTVIPASYENGFWFGLGSRMLYTSQNNSNVELTINTTNKYGITLEWYGELEEGYNEKGTWSVEILKSGVWTAVPNSSMILQNKPVLIIFPMQDRETKSVTLDSYADNNPSLHVRIKASGLNDKIRIDNFIITSRSPKIEVSGYNTTNVLTKIPVNSPAGTIYGTDFGMVITSSLTATGYSDKVFRIQNNGAATLNISAINFSGNNPADFAVIGAFPATVDAGTTKDFTVRFNPASDGISSAILNIYSNANPSPYSYYLEGRGASCKSEDVVLKSNSMETAVQSLESTPDAATPNNTFYKISGTNSVNTSSSLTPNFRLYGPVDDITNYSLFTSSNTSWYSAPSKVSVINFGPVDVSNEKEVLISFNLAAFTSTKTAVFNNNDVVRLEVLDPDTNTWSNEVEVKGINSTSKNSRFTFTSGGTTYQTNYDGNNNPAGGAEKYSTVKLKFLSSSKFTDLVFRITATSNLLKYWLIDDVSVSSANSIYKTFTGTGTTGWKNSANANTAKPTIEEKAIIAANYDTSVKGNIIACECEVLSGKSVVVKSGALVTLENKLVLNPAIGITPAATFTIESDGNLIQNDNLAVNVNKGDIVSQQKIKVGAVRDQYNYLGTPVDFAAGETFKTIYPGTTSVLYHNETNNFFYNSSGVNIPGRGLAVKEPTGNTATTITALFKGVPQNGNITIGVTNKDTNVNTFGYNLLGNPYPSNIDLLKLYDLNGGKTGSSQVVSPNISSTFYFWDNTGNGQTTQQGSGYLGQAYAIFNVLTGNNGTGTKSTLGTKVPTNIVKVGQGFMMRTLLTNYSFKFNNSIRTAVIPEVDYLGKETSTVEDNRYWLQMTSPSGITSTIAIVHYQGGNNLFGPEDSRSMGGSDALYTLVEQEKISIDGRSSFTDTDVIPLGSKHYSSGDYTLTLDATEGIFANGQNIYLKDKQTGVITNLSQGSYTFQANEGESTGRFEIIYKPETVLVTDTQVKEGITIYRDQDNFVIKSPKMISQVQVYDASGKLITVLKPNNKKVILNAAAMTNGIYILNITAVDGEVTNKKIAR